MVTRILLAVGLTAASVGTASAAAWESCSAMLVGQRGEAETRLGKIAYSVERGEDSTVVAIVICKDMVARYSGKVFPQQKFCVNGAAFTLSKELKTPPKDDFDHYALVELTCD